MGKTGRLYSPEFKEEAVRLVHSSEERYPVTKIARDLDVSAETLSKWVNQAEIDAGEWKGLTTEEREELRKLHKEVKVLKEDSWFSSRGRPTASITISVTGWQLNTYAVGAFLAAVAGRDTS